MSTDMNEKIRKHLKSRFYTEIMRLRSDGLVRLSYEDGDKIASSLAEIVTYGIDDSPKAEPMEDRDDISDRIDQGVKAYENLNKAREAMGVGAARLVNDPRVQAAKDYASTAFSGLSSKMKSVANDAKLKRLTSNETLMDIAIVGYEELKAENGAVSEQDFYEYFRGFHDGDQEMIVVKSVPLDIKRQFFLTVALQAERQAL